MGSVFKPVEKLVSYPLRLQKKLAENQMEEYKKQNETLVTQLEEMSKNKQTIYDEYSDTLLTDLSDKRKKGLLGTLLSQRMFNGNKKL